MSSTQNQWADDSVAAGPVKSLAPARSSSVQKVGTSAATIEPDTTHQNRRGVAELGGVGGMSRGGMAFMGSDGSLAL